MAPEPPGVDLAVAITPEEPIERVDAAAFAARALAASLHDRLKEAGRNCLRLKVVAELSSGTRVERVWRTREALSEAATADRVRWQLDGWLTAQRTASSSDGTGGIVSLVLEPLELAEPDAVGELWADGSSTDGARRVIERVQSQLGIDAVVQPRFVGGRGVAERIRLVPFGEAAPEAVEHAARHAWPGAIPAPLPARLGGGIDHPASRIVLIGAAAKPIHVTAEAILSARPYALAWGDKKYLVTAWAGPWPVDEGWWAGEANHNRVARLQVVGREAAGDTVVAAPGGAAAPSAGGAAAHSAAAAGEVTGWLLAWTRRSWRVEAVY